MRFARLGPANLAEEVSPRVPSSHNHSHGSRVADAVTKSSNPFAVPHVVALEQIRRTRGGSQAQLMRCDDESLYVVKFQNNPQGLRILINELVASRLARLIGIPVAQPAVVSVDKDLINGTEDLVIQHRSGREICKPGLQFGSRYCGTPIGGHVWDMFPVELKSRISNLKVFAGVLAFDIWLGNADERQAVFAQWESNRPYDAYIVDNGLCFNGCRWNFPLVPSRSRLYPSHYVYDTITGIHSFEPWLTRIETIDQNIFIDIFDSIPSEWLESNKLALARLLASLYDRRLIVRQLIVATICKNPRAFGKWTGLI